MNVIDKTRKALGLNPKQDDGITAPHTNLTPDYFGDEEAALREAQKAAMATPPSDDTTDDDLADTGDEPRTEEEQVAYAAERLEKLDLGEGSWSLIDRALDSIARNTGAGLDDPDARLRAKELGQLVAATDNQLDILVAATVQSTPVLDRGLAVKNVLYRVLSQCVFFANLDYRQAEGMDLYSDEATVAQFFGRYVSSEYVEEALGRVVDDQTLDPENVSTKEVNDTIRDMNGFEDRRDAELRYLRETYGVDDDLPHLAVLQALIDVQLLFDLTAQTYGWSPNDPIPYGNVAETNGTFTPITDAQTALDATEIKRAAAQKRRREQRSAQMSKAQELAASMVAASLARPTNHRIKR